MAPKDKMVSAWFLIICLLFLPLVFPVSLPQFPVIPLKYCVSLHNCGIFIIKMAMSHAENSIL